MITPIGDSVDAFDRINQIVQRFSGPSTATMPLGASGAVRTFAAELTAQDLAAAGTTSPGSRPAGGYPLASAAAAGTGPTIGVCSDCGSVHVIDAATSTTASNATGSGAVKVSSNLDWSSPGDEVPAGTPYAEQFTAAARANGLSPKLLAAVAEVESNYRLDAVSPVGAQGLMQFMPETAASLGVDPWDPSSAIDGAARYLRQMTDRFGSVEAALAAYNVGPGTVARAGGVVPSAAQRYVDKVLARANGGAR